MVIKPVTQGGCWGLLAHPANDGEPMERPSKEKDKEDGKDEGRRHDPGIRKDAHDIINPGVFVASRDDAQANAPDSCQQTRKKNQLKRSREKLDDIGCDRALGDQRQAKITPHGIAAANRNTVLGEAG